VNWEWIGNGRVEASRKPILSAKVTTTIRYYYYYHDHHYDYDYDYDYNYDYDQLGGMNR
jgi:hypothetical protein